MWDSYESAVDAIERLEKSAFVPMPAGQPMPPEQPPMDPAMAGGAPPMDPAMAGGAPPMDPAMMGGAPPMDPAMAGGAPPMDPAMAGGAPPADPGAEQAMVFDMITQAVRQVIQEMGIEIPEGKGEGDKSESKSESDGEGGKDSRLEKLEGTVDQIAAALGIMPEGEGGGGPDAAAGMSAGAGMPSDGTGAMPMMGPLDPAGGMGMADAAAMSGAPMPSPTEMPKTGGFKPLDDMGWAKNMAASLKKVRTSM